MTRRDLLSKIYWTVALLAVFLLAFFASVVFLNPTSVGREDFVKNLNLWAVIWALNFIIVLIISYILARDVIKLLFDFKAKRPGSRIKSKLITTFVIFSMFPALIMSFMAFGLINRNLRLWVTSPSEQLLDSSRVIVREYEQRLRDSSLLAARLVAQRLREPGFPTDTQLEAYRAEAGLDAVLVTNDLGNSLGAGQWQEEGATLDRARRAVLADGTFFDRHRLEGIGLANVDLVTVGVRLEGDAGSQPRFLFGQRRLPESVAFYAIQVEEARQRLEELKSSVGQVEINYFSILALTTLSVIFGFVWLGAYIARKITVPLEALADGAHALAEGKFDHRVDVQAADELGILVDAFNTMAEEIKHNRQQLEAANSELMTTNVELDERRRYTEKILHNIATGVISVDEADMVRTINEAALGMLQISREKILNHSIRELADKDLQREFQKMKKQARLYGTCRKNVALRRGENHLYIAATVTANPLPLRDKEEYLIVLDDLTELIKAEKFAAWQEVARRLAHEIKNPLTPIQLSAERIQKRFEKMVKEHNGSPQLAEFSTVLGDAVRIISVEADLLKNLVNEFSRFARLPISRPVETDIHAFIEQTLALYDGGLQSVGISRSFDPGISVVEFDPEQLRRVLVNLIDNSLDALSDRKEDRQIGIATRFNPTRHSVTIEFRDNGSGIAPEDYEHLFLPYFSTKKKGTGLGLAIVRQIISEHNGYIRAEPNHPQGTKFIMEIPLNEGSTVQSL